MLQVNFLSMDFSRQSSNGLLTAISSVLFRKVDYKPSRADSHPFLILSRSNRYKTMKNDELLCYISWTTAKFITIPERRILVATSY